MSALVKASKLGLMAPFTKVGGSIIKLMAVAASSMLMVTYTRANGSMT